jgi:hypothetical protein
MLEGVGEHSYACRCGTSTTTSSYADVSANKSRPSSFEKSRHEGGTSGGGNARREHNHRLNHLVVQLRRLCKAVMEENAWPLCFQDLCHFSTL